MDAWIQDEVNGCTFGDRRLGQRLGKLLGSLSERMGKGLPLACQDWAATKAAYRFLDNPRVDEGAILEGHFQATRARFAESRGWALVLHDTTELSYQRTRTEPIGKMHKTVAGKHRDGRPHRHLRHRQLAGLLVVHDQPDSTGRCSLAGVHRDRNATAGPRRPQTSILT